MAGGCWSPMPQPVIEPMGRGNRPRMDNPIGEPGGASRGWSSPDAPVALPVPSQAAPPAPPVHQPVGAVPLSLRLRPRTFISTLDAGFDLLTYRWAEMMAVTVAIMLPLYAIPQAIAAGTQYTAADELERTLGDASVSRILPSGLGFSAFGVWQMVTMFGAMASIALVGVAVSHLAAGWILGGEPTIRSALRLAVRRSGVVVAALAATLPLRLVGVAACFIGLAFVVTWLLMVSPVIALEGVGPIEAIKRSARLANRRFGTTLAVVIFGALIVQVASGVMGAILGGVIAGLAGTGPLLVLGAGVLGLFLTLVFTPLHASWAVLAYFDARVRTEGIDMELGMVDVFGSADGRP